MFRLALPESSLPHRTARRLSGCPRALRRKRVQVAGVLLLFAVAAFLGGAAIAPADDEVGMFEVHEWSIWVADPTMDQANALAPYSSAMPGMVETERTRIAQPAKISPVHVLTMHGEPAPDVEAEVRLQSGRFLAHWPPAERKNNRLRWFEIALTKDLPDDTRVATVDPQHWFDRARKLDSHYLKQGARAEKFITYDIEAPLTLELKLKSDGEKYGIVNLSNHALLDLWVSVPSPAGRRIGRVALVPPAAGATPTGAPAGSPPSVVPGGIRPGGALQPGVGGAAVETKAEAVETKKDEDKAESDKAGADKKESDKVEAKPDAAAATAVEVPAGSTLPAIETPAQPSAEGAAAQPVATPEQVIDVAMTGLLAADSQEMTDLKAAFQQELVAAGLTTQEAELAASMATEGLFNSDELVVLYRLPPEIMEEKVPLIFYPSALRTVRVPLVLVRNLDPRISDEVRDLVLKLGAEAYPEREAAEKRLRELGRLAVPALKEALASTDVEIAYRAERILLAQNESIDLPVPAAAPAAGVQAVPAAAGAAGVAVPAVITAPAVKGG